MSLSDRGENLVIKRRSMSNHREIVILGMFDLTRLGSARAVRIHNLHMALQAFASRDLDFRKSGS